MRAKVDVTLEQFIEAESRLLNAQFEAKQAEVELLRLSGQLLDQY